LENTFLKAFNELEGGRFEAYLINLTGTKEFLSAVKALEKITKRKRVLMVLDTLESYKIFAPSMIDGFRGVLEAIAAFCADSRMQGIAIKFFLPAEIYEKVSTGIPAKVGGGTVFMRWKSADLISLLAGRYLSVLEKTAALSKSRLGELRSAVDNAYRQNDGRDLRDRFWYETEFLSIQIRNTFGKEEDCLAYMTRHTFRRPRDSIMQMQAIVNRAVLAGEFPRISSDSVVRGVHDQGVLSYMLGDALSPFEHGVPGEVINNARSAFYDRPWLMSGRELKRFAKALYDLHPFEDIDSEAFAQLLLRAGCVGLPLQAQSDLYHKAGFEYLKPDTLPFRDDLEYCVHPVVGDLFQMRKPPDGKAVYPMPEEDDWLEKAAGI